MKYFALFFLCSCQAILLNPEVDKVGEKIVEDVIEDIVDGIEGKI